MTNINKVRLLPHLQCIQNFPYVDESINAINDWQILQKYGAKIDEIINSINNNLETIVLNEIDKFFTDKMINTFYDDENETLILKINNTEV